MKETILITWTSWFIWFHLSFKLLEKWCKILWIDNENDYYDISLKEIRRNILIKNPNFVYYKWNLEDANFIKKVFDENKIDKVCNLAWQAGVRYSLENPSAYIQSNLVGFFNVIENAKQHNIKNFVYASSSSVYWKNDKIPFSVEDKVDYPISLYAATKKSNELIAHVYSHLYKLPTIWLRFFTVYGTYGRPDMAINIFADKILKWQPINVFNHGKMKRDFTHVNDIVNWIIKCLDSNFDYEIFNLWNNNVVELEYLIELMEINLKKKAIKNYMDIQPWDVPATWADIDYTIQKLWWQPTTKIENGIKTTMEWYKQFYK